MAKRNAEIGALRRWAAADGTALLHQRRRDEVPAPSDARRMVQPGQEIRGRVMKPTILTCAVTGSFPTRAQTPALPVTPQEIAEACIGAAKAGAAICHIHVREPDSGRPSMKLEYYREVVERIRGSDTDLIINLTAGPGGRLIPSDDEPAKAAPGTVLTTMWSLNGIVPFEWPFFGPKQLCN